jgi:hypothetical protein
MSAFQKYWDRLKATDPELYEEKLLRNRTRIQNIRNAIYDDPEKHELYKEQQRKRYAKRKGLKTKTE